jgi:hypothetical protein
MNMHMMMPAEDIIAAAQRNLAARWDGATILRQMVLLSEFVKTVEPVVPEKNRRYELASEGLAGTSRPQDWKTIRKLMTFRVHLTADTMRRVTGTKLDTQGNVLRLKALDPAGQKQLVDALLDGWLDDHLEHWRQFVGIWRYRAIYPDPPTDENMKAARKRLMQKHYAELKKIEKAKKDNTHVGVDVQSGIRRLVKVWNEVPPLARLMFLQEQDRLEEGEAKGDAKQ